MILRISNVLGFDLNHSNSFISKLLNSLRFHKQIKLDLHQKTYKDFITPIFFSKSLDKLIMMNKTGTYNFLQEKKLTYMNYAMKLLKVMVKEKLFILKSIPRLFYP